MYFYILVLFHKSSLLVFFSIGSSGLLQFVHEALIPELIVMLDL